MFGLVFTGHLCCVTPSIFGIIYILCCIFFVVSLFMLLAYL